MTETNRETQVQLTRAQLTSDSLPTKPGWTRPRVEVLNFEQTLNSGFVSADGAYSTQNS